ncbi:MAG: hypothetical protein CM1200mP2_03200 [Planctomycetaceae bacterium]|nr:MAG: hypothetical protein CM1200mP2_03200 [Planctomycetaceae bacterium]
MSAEVLSGNRSLRMQVDDFGVMTFELFESRAPRVTSRIIELVESGVYTDTIFHRVIDDFVLQGGDPTGTGFGDPTLADFDDQFHVDLQHNSTGLLSMAKTTDDTNSSQFFITEGPSRHLGLQPLDLRSPDRGRVRPRGNQRGPDRRIQSATDRRGASRGRSV